MIRSLIYGALLLAVLAASPAHAASPTPDSCRELRNHGQRPEASACFTALIQSANPYFRAEGFWGTEQYDLANGAFRDAIAQPEVSPIEQAHNRVRWGLLLHQRFNNKDADDLFEEALKQNPSSAEAYLGLAQVSADGFDNKSKEYAAKALALDPKFVEAHEFVANLSLEDARTPEAIAEADKALALSNQALQAMAVHAAADLLADRNADAEAWFAKIRAVNPTYAEGYALVGYHLVLNRRYEDGIAYYRKAVEADPRLWSARSQLGINLMRLGQEDEPLKQLSLSYDNGQRDAATVNSLRLLDSYKNFVTFHSVTPAATTNLKLRKNEAELLRPYFETELNKSIATYEKKYKMRLPGPVQLEVYPDHEDFAVRTMGMPGLGALGVTFGEVVAMDSPSGRKPGDFNWGATLWHEMSHVFILSATNHRVPRWFAEGLAVHEEGEAVPEWKSRPTPEVLLALRDKKFLPVSDIDRGFIFPEYPSQVTVSYFEAGSMCDYIKQRWSDDKLLDMVHSFAALKTTPQVIQTDLQISLDQFDKDYMAWLQKQYGQTAASFDEWRKALKEVAALSKLDQPDAVIQKSPAVIKLYPDYVGDANVYEVLAQAQLAKADKPGAMTSLKTYESLGGMNPDALKKLASLEEEQGQPKEAATTFNRINFIYPEADGLHQHLGNLWLAQSNYTGAEREFAAALAMNPLDKASAEFNLAQAYFADGDKTKAEDSVLLALESAPGFRPAQKLLLQIKSSETDENKTSKPDKPN